jgi:hypothetical protein
MTWLLSVYLLNGKRATNLPQDKVRMLRQGVEVDIDILQQGCKGGPLRGGVTSRRDQRQNHSMRLASGS